ncbi:hypothetical protein GWG65_13920 [Bradyrhizobium sp. CSA207]|uniref:hypothetical protein n=1 Tax=Bradyrhizobium sp. CSA207 TaxID=2698826 RepID=UPI0023AFC923|nr:hypothetical protein [Bradyrhizobium sp. CSA207]MDE5442526.1 hypothetical protein [Bradyrhizobium sp. CSA207]
MSAVTDELDARLRPIAELCEGEVSFRKEGWRELILMKALRLVASGAQHKIDAILCLNHDNPTYPTKLYLAQPVGSDLNWNETVYLLDRSWHTFSWSNVSPDQPWFDILAAHLRAIDRGGKP